MLVYSDPAEDGFKKGRSFPMGRGDRKATFSGRDHLRLHGAG